MVLFPLILVFERVFGESLEKFEGVLLLRSLADDAATERIDILGATDEFGLLLVVLRVSDETTDAYDFGPFDEDDGGT